LGKDCRAVEGNDIDATHLLRNHDDTGGNRCAPNTRDGNEFDATGEEVAFFRDPGFGNEDFFLAEKCVCIVQIASCLDWGRTEA
jgi:hypothetical protein